ncbi:hypothetical protein CcCBS67573_g03992 [Chytriomyces confervae]|uniref:Ran GTPase-activating protein 1 n=1 Tax=Chytriomyces confervae TaxID=246404 RepID=A0A507FER4_9FUNG|nr:hypothetical protein CcCBS67573_g03992 [Chytriomyces confervae]
MVKFSLEGRVLKLTTSADAAAIVAELNAVSNEALDEIVFSGNTFGIDAAKAVADALRTKTRLRVANLGDIFTGRLKDEIPQALDAFVDALVDKAFLNVIDLCDNAFGPVGAAPIRRLFIENTNITTLKLNNNGLGIEGGRLIATSLLDAAKASKSGFLENMQTIIMGRNRLETNAAIHMSQALAVLPNLRELRMPQNGIRPEGVAVLVTALGKNCPLLEVLDLQDNTFTTPGSQALASALKSWPHLHTLNVGDCLLGKVGSKVVIKALTPATIAQKLQVLLLQYNEMNLAGANLIPTLIANHKALKSLTLNGNTFDAEDEVVDKIKGAFRANGHVDALDELEDMEEEDSDAEEEDEMEEDEKEEEKSDEVDALADSLGDAKINVPAGVKFSLEGRVLKLNTAADAASIVADLNAIADQALEEIVFSGNTFGVEAAKAVAAALRSKVSLKIANLSDIFTGRLKDEIPQALDAFVDAFVDKKMLQVIDLCDNAFGPIGAAPIRRLFIENRFITTLKLNNNGLGIEGGRLIATSLMDAAAASDSKVLANMQTIIMGRNRLEAKAAMHMSEALAVLPNLRELRMPQNGIRPEGIAILVTALGKNCPILEVLDLQDNTFTTPGSAALASALKLWPHLHTLNVGDCLLGKAGSKLVLESLNSASVAPKLHTLSLQYNEMNLSGAQLVPGVIASHKALKSLTLNGNTFDAEDAIVEKIRAAFAANGHVNALDELEDMEEEDSEAEEEEDDE